MLAQTDRQENGSLLCSENLTQVSIALKKGRTVQSKAMDFILTMLSCIVLNVDHRTRSRVSGYGFSNRRLNVLRKDLEDLLYFHKKCFDSLIIVLLLETLGKEINCRHVKLNNTVEVTSMKSIGCYKFTTIDVNSVLRTVAGNSVDRKDGVREHTISA